MAWERIIATTANNASYWSGVSRFSDTLEYFSNTDDQVAGRSVQMVFARTTPSQTREDRIVTSLHFSKIAGGGLYSDLSDADCATVEGLLDSMHTAIKPYIASGISLVEYRWHVFGAGIAKPGPATRVTSRSVAGTAANGRMPDQVCATSTFRTSSRKHWGRTYWPLGTTQALDTTYGRFSRYTDLATAIKTMYTGADAASIALVVWSQQFRGLLTIDELRVDDIFDIQRRRRAKQVSGFVSHVS